MTGPPEYDMGDVAEYCDAQRYAEARRRRMDGTACFACNGSGWEPPPHPDEDTGTDPAVPCQVCEGSGRTPER